MKEQEEIEFNEQENFFTNKSHLNEFEEFASEKPLHSPKSPHLTSPFDDDNNGLWTKIEKPINDEPWELEDNGEEKLTPIPTTKRFTSPFNDDDDDGENILKEKLNFFSDSFNPNEDIEQTVTKTVRFDDNIQSIRSPTPPLSARETFDSSENNSDKIDLDDITPNMEASFVTINENDLKV